MMALAQVSSGLSPRQAAPVRVPRAASSPAPPGPGLFVLGLLAELAWAFVGSLLLGLGDRATSQPQAAWLWLAGAAAIPAALMAFRWLVARRQRPRYSP